MARTDSPEGGQGLAVLPAESWGWRMKRAREEYAGMTLAVAVSTIGEFFLTSSGAISRMEDSEDVPTDRRRRALAFVAASIYGLDPEQFGLGPDAVPAAIRERLLERAKGPGPDGPGSSGAYPPWDSNPEPADYPIIDLTWADAELAEVA